MADDMRPGAEREPASPGVLLSSGLLASFPAEGGSEEWEEEEEEEEEEEGEFDDPDDDDDDWDDDDDGEDDEGEAAWGDEALNVDTR